MKTVYKLSDKTIAQIVRLLQFGLLTGTDISDQFRTLRVVLGEDNLIEPDPSFMEDFELNLEKLQEEASSQIQTENYD
jgi:hypothetical protein